MVRSPGAVVLNHWSDREGDDRGIDREFCVIAALMAFAGLLTVYFAVR